MGFVGKNKVDRVEYYKSQTDRQFLKINVKFPPIKDKVLVVMKNPSTTCNNLNNGSGIITSYSDKAKCHIDRTTGKVLRKLKNSYDEIIVLNLYSLYNSSPKNINVYYYGSGAIPTIFRDNNKFVRKYLNLYSGDVICAWGRPNGIENAYYDKQINYVTSLFNTNHHNLLEYDSARKKFINWTRNNYPPHGLTW